MLSCAPVRSQLSPAAMVSSTWTIENTMPAPGHSRGVAGTPLPRPAKNQNQAAARSYCFNSIRTR
jgi:hypothetical protein